MTGRRHLVRTVVVGVALLYCTAPAAAADAAGAATRLGTGDDGAVITVHVGDTISVHLAPDGQFHFSTPTSSDDTVLRRQGGRGHHRHHGVTGGQATFVAVAAGTASLEAFGTIQCHGHHVCPAERGEPTRLLARRWHVDVTVE